MIHITNGQSDEILDYITDKHFFSDVHRQSLKDNLETFEFTTFADKPFSEHLGKLNRVIIPAEDQGYKEFIINESLKYRDGSGLKAEIYADASYLALKKAEPIAPQTFKEETPTTIVSRATNGTEWRPGIIEGKGYRTFHIEKHTNPYAFLKRIATEFGLELHFRVEVSGGHITGRYVDLLERIGDWRGREVEFGRDLIGIRRMEKTDSIYTALKGLGPEKEDGSRLEVIVTDEEALQRWGRPDPITGELQYLWDTYEPQSTDQDMTKSRLTELIENELEKRVNEVVEYESTIADLENVPGMENKKIRFGDTIKIKDTKFNPPLYLEARVHTQERSIKDKSQKNVVLGDYIEYTEEQVQAIWQSMQAEIRRRLARMLITNIASSAGDTFKNGEGSTELTAEVFLSGAVVDETGEMYSYVWNKRDKNGIPVTNWNKSGKTITITAADIDEKATYTVDVILDTVLSIGRLTITNVFDGQDGAPGEQGVPGPAGEDGQTLYTWVKYADDEQGKGMSDSPYDKEYMGIAYNKTSPTKGTNPIDYNWAKIKGNQGVPGEPGADGTPRYTWTKYADDKDGNGMSDDPEGKRYLGLAYNKTSASESNNASDYSWSPLYDNVSPGGRNLIPNSAFKNNFEGWSIQGDVSLLSDKYLGMPVARTYDPSSTGSASLRSPYIELDQGEDYTLSFYGKGVPSDVINRIYLYDEDNNETRQIRLTNSFTVTKWGQLKKTFSLEGGETKIRVMIGYFWSTPTGEFLFTPPMLERSNVASDWSPAPEDVNKAIDDAQQAAEGHADAVSEAAYSDAIADAEAYLEANGLIKGRDYNGVSITNQDGFVTVRGDGLVRTVSNSTLGYVIQRRASKSSSWQNVLYFDTNGNLKFAGDLEGATGTFSGSLVVTDSDGNVETSLTPNEGLLMIDLRDGATNAMVDKFGNARFNGTIENLRGINTQGDIKVTHGFLYSDALDALPDELSRGMNIYVRPKPGGEFRATETNTTDQYVDGRFRYLKGDALDVNDKGEGVHLYLRPAPTGEARITERDSTGTYLDLRARNLIAQSKVTAGANGAFESSSGYVILRSTGTGIVYLQSNSHVRATKIGSGSSYIPISALSFDAQSTAETKQDIQPWQQSALNLINSVTLYQYLMKSDVEDNLAEYVRHGLVIGEGYETPKELISRNGDGIDQYEMNSWSWKAIQELSEENSVLRSSLSKLEQRIEILENQSLENGEL